MEYADAIALLEDMKSRFEDGFSSSDRCVLEELHRELFNRGISNKGCGDCYRDAYVIIYKRLKETKTMPKAKSLYTLKAGAILRRPGDNRFYANPLPNDEIPEKYLADYPQNINLFASYPNDWEARVTRRKSGQLPEGELSQEEAKNIIAGLEAENAALKAELDELHTAAIADTSDTEEIGNLNLQIQALMADVESANNEINDLKAEKAKLEEELNALKEKPAKKSSKKSEE